MTLPKFKNEGGWKSYEQFQAATDEQVAEWLEWAKATDIENKVIYREYAKLYQTIMAGIKELYGDKSKEYKYMDKTSISGTSYYYDYFVNHFNDYDRYRKEFLQKKANEERKDKQSRETLEKERKALFMVWEIARRHNINVVEDTDAEEVMEGLIDLDRYLDLASAMEDTRNDWRDGFDRVRNALQRFESSTDHSIGDEAIIEDISQILDGDENDGRVFRDTRYSYGVIYDLADKQIMKDYLTLKRMSTEYH